MEIYSYLKQDHRLVAELFEKIISARSETSRKTLFNELCEALKTHTSLEEKIFYQPLSNRLKDPEEMKHAYSEHKEVDQLMAAIKKFTVVNDKWLEKLGELKHAVEHHVHKEEDDIFPKAKEVISSEEAKAFAIAMEQGKLEMAKAE